MGEQVKNKSRSYPSVAKLKAAEHTGIVKEIFASITREYDFLNHLLSLRCDIAWRKTTVAGMRFFQTGRFLDVATGTADVAVAAALAHPRIRVVGIDLSREMLEAGRAKIRKRNLGDRISLMEGDALQLPFPDNHFDVVAVAFGIRNIPDRMRALREMRRVLIPGGQIMVLEMSLPEEGSPMRPFYSFYIRKVLPFLARPFSADVRAYAYLADSISLFPTPRKFAAMMQEAGFKSISQKRLSLGITYLHVGYKRGARAD